MTSAGCGEDGGADFTGVIDCFDPTILGWTVTRRCRARDVSPALERAWSTAWSHGPAPDHEVVVVCRQLNGTQFTSIHDRDVAAGLGITLSRTAHRHPAGNAVIERLYRTTKEECVWPNEFASYDEALAAIDAWGLDDTNHRPHHSLADRTPAQARAEALNQLKSAA